MDEATDLAAISPAAAPMPPVEDDRTAAALHRLHEHEQRLEIMSRVLIQEAREASVVMSDREQRQVLAELRPEWGKCLTTPDTGEIDLGTQSDEPLRQATLKAS